MVINQIIVDNIQKKNTEFVYANWTPRSNAYFPEATDGVVVVGIQYMIKKYLIKTWNEKFFNLPKHEILESFADLTNNYLGSNEIGVSHIEELWDLGYLPIKIKALPEGSFYPIKVPMLTIVNTDERFFWLANYL